MDLISSIIHQEFENSISSRFDITEKQNAIRLSSIGSCLRKAFFTGVGWPGYKEYMDPGIIEMGNITENWLVERLSKHFEIITQDTIEVPGGLASGHSDIVIPELKLVIECKNVAEGAVYYGLPKEDHIFQLQSYLHYKYQVLGYTGLFVYLTRPNPYPPHLYPCVYNSTIGAEIERRVAYLAECFSVGNVPEITEKMKPTQYPCFWASGENKVYCTYHNECWPKSCASDLQPVQLAEVKDLIEGYYSLKEQAKPMNKQVKAIEDARKKIESSLQHYFDSYGNFLTTEEGKGVLRKFQTTEKWDIQKAFECGIIPVEVIDALKPFKKVNTIPRVWPKDMEEN